MNFLLARWSQPLLLCFGLAFLKAGFFTYAFTEGIFPYLAAGELMISLPTIISYATLSGVLLLLAYIAKAAGTLERRPGAAIVSTAILVVGSFLGLLSRDPFGLDAWSVLSAMCVGGSSAVMFVIWGEMLSHFSYYRIKILVGLTLIITFLLYLLVLLVPYPLSSALIILFPLVSGILLAPFMRTFDVSAVEEERESDSTEILAKLSPPYRKWIVLLGLPHFVLSVVNVALWSLSNAVAGPEPFTFLLLAFAGGTVFAVFLFLLVLNNESRLQVSSLTQYAIPLLLIAPALVVLSGQQPALTVFSFMLVCSTIVFADFLNWILFCELAHEEPGHRTVIVGLGRFFIYSGMLGGCLVGRMVMHRFIPGQAEQAWVQVLGVAVIVLTALMVFVNAVEQYRVDELFREFSKQAPSKTDLNEHALARIRKTFGLTPRECEVLVLLYEGKTAPQIQTKLVISLNTVNSHAKRIYKKLDVHTRVELFNKLEQLRKEEASRS